MRDLRARQASGGVPRRAPGPRDAESLLVTHVDRTVAALDLEDCDRAAAALAREYAAAIDSSENLGYSMRWIAPLLLDALDALGATPASRARMKVAKKAPPGPPNRLQQLRDTRAAADEGRR